MENLKIQTTRTKQRKKKVSLEDLSLSPQVILRLDYIAKTLAKQIDKEVFVKKYAPVADVLKLVGAGAFLAASIAVPNLPLTLKPFLSNSKEYEAWKRFNIPYLKRTFERLEKQKLVEIKEQSNMQIVEITGRGRKRILRYALDELAIKKPKFWDGKWRLVSYDIPQELKGFREIFSDYLRAWGFYPLHESVFLHACPCEKEVEFLREYLGIGKYVRVFKVSQIENDVSFRDFFGI